jgi:hypothetical protein
MIKEPKLYVPYVDHQKRCAELEAELEAKTKHLNTLFVAYQDLLDKNKRMYAAGEQLKKHVSYVRFKSRIGQFEVLPEAFDVALDEWNAALDAPRA